MLHITAAPWAIWHILSFDTSSPANCANFAMRPR